VVASHVPPGNYPKWAGYANDVVAGAQGKDMKKVSAACKGCHTDYKQAYRAQHATRPYP
jgi:hypothetical protein